MATTISAKCKTLADAAIKRWPDVYGSEVRTELARKLETIGDDEAAQVLAARTFLLDWAAKSCGMCESCSLFNNRLCGPVWADGAPNARVFVIGEGPGQYEQRTTIPFTYAPELSRSYCRLVCAHFKECIPVDAMKDGTRLAECVKSRKPVTKAEAVVNLSRPIPHIITSSEHLNKSLDGLFTRDSANNGKVMVGEERVASDLYITNIVKCRSINKQGKDTAPGAEFTKACWKWLELQLTIVQPIIVISLGTPAGSVIFDKPDFGIKQFAGKFGLRHDGSFPKLPSSVKFVGTAFHPSYVGHQYEASPQAGDEALKTIRTVFEKAHHILNGG